ncbi:MAG: hypothetical protein E7385_04430 [Ruminococcaceae bacterium]|nr:hypothetical protein [Oscillospiraceae bacterium]
MRQKNTGPVNKPDIDRHRGYTYIPDVSYFLPGTNRNLLDILEEKKEHSYQAESGLQSIYLLYNDIWL